MIIFLFAGAIVFFLIPLFSRGKTSFVDYFILFCLYFDATSVLAGSQQNNYSYYHYSLVLVFSLYYLLFEVQKVTNYHKKVFFATIIFLVVLLLFPIFRGADINQTVRTFSVNFASIIILPISFHYYSQKGNIYNLLHSGYYFIIFWMFVVILFTVFKIDVTTEYMGSEQFGGGIFYFGDMSRRGALTYISFALLLVPLIYNYLNYHKKISLLIGTGFLFMIMVVALKRFAFVAVILGLLNYFLKSSLKLKIKIRIGIGLSAIIALLFLTTNLEEVIIRSYKAKGTEEKFSEEAISSDIRIYEPIYVSEYVLSGTISEILFGKEFEISMDINTVSYRFEDRKIHNQYGQYILLYGFLGLIAYLAVFIILYKITLHFKKALHRYNINVNEYWIVFQNLVLIFIIEGMVGGHVHLTFRSLVLLFSGGISGYFYKLLRSKMIK